MMHKAFNNTMMSGVFCDDLPLSSIEIPDGKAPRNLVRSIREQGLIEPPVLLDTQTGNKTFTVLAGIRRLQAIREINPDALVVAIIRSDAKASPAVTLSENLVRSRNFVAEIQAYKALRRQSLNEDDIQKHLGLYKRDVKKLEQLVNLSAKAEAALEAGKLAPSAALVMAKMEKQQQDAFFDEYPDVVSKYTLASVKDWRMRQLLPDSQLSFLADMPFN